MKTSLNQFAAYFFACSLIFSMNSCSESDSDSDKGESSSADYFFKYELNGEKINESGQNNSFSSLSKSSGFNLLEGKTRIRVFHEGTAPDKLIGKPVKMVLKYDEHSSEQGPADCTCQLSKVKKEGEPMSGFGQPYRVKGTFDNCILALPGGNDEQTASNGEFDIVLYFDGN